MNHQHVFTLVKTIHRANFNTISIFTIDAVIIDDIGHLRSDLLRLVGATNVRDVDATLALHAPLCIAETAIRQDQAVGVRGQPQGRIQHHQQTVDQPAGASIETRAHQGCHRPAPPARSSPE